MHAVHVFYFMYLKVHITFVHGVIHKCSPTTEKWKLARKSEPLKIYFVFIYMLVACDVSKLQ